MIEKVLRNKIFYKVEDRMLFGSLADCFMQKVRYNDERCYYNHCVMTSQKHRMIFYKRLKKEFFEESIQNRIWENYEKDNHNDTIWFCWMQGLDNAPELVKVCYQSILKNAHGKNIIVIDESNMYDYVQLPQYIIDKWKSGKIGMAHFSDLLRIELLIKHGGYWIDSTVLCTDDRIFDAVDCEPLFMYSFYYFGFNSEIMELNNWFIKSTTNNNILCLVRELLYKYWKKYDRAVNYYIFQLFMTMAVDYYKEEFEKMPIISQVDSHILATYIYDDIYDEHKYQILKQQTGVHKLSTRFDKKKIDKKNSFYDVVIRNRNY